MTAAVLAGATGASVLLAVSAHAETITGDLCGGVDYQAPIGTTVSLTVTADCGFDSFEIFTGIPTVSITPNGNGQLVWHKAIEKTATACEAGWGESWQQWAKGGQGGAVCVTDVVWGTGPAIAGNVSVTLNTALDYVRLTSSTAFEPDVLGCDAFYPGYSGYTHEDSCPRDR